MISAVGYSLSALKAASSSLAARADNIANSRTTARLDESAGEPSSHREAAENTFRPARPVFVARNQGGVDVKIEAVKPAHQTVFDPRDERANEEGLVAMPNVSLEEELVGSLQDRAMHEVNLAVMRTVEEMSGAFWDDEA